MAYVSRSPPIIPDGQISRVRFETLAFLPQAFPSLERFKRWSVYTPGREIEGVGIGVEERGEYERPRAVNGDWLTRRIAKRAPGIIFVATIERIDPPRELALLAEIGVKMLLLILRQKLV
jgi:hypothetical protein